MKLADVQPAAVALIEADALLSSFAPVLVPDGVTDIAATIDEALQEKGVCVALGEIVWDNADTGDEVTPILATLYVNIYENPQHTHTPRGYALIDAVASALTRRRAFLAGRGMRMEDEKGGTVTVNEFHTHVVLNEQ